MYILSLVFFLECPCIIFLYKKNVIIIKKFNVLNIYLVMLLTFKERKHKKITFAV